MNKTSHRTTIWIAIAALAVVGVAAAGAAPAASVKPAGGNTGALMLMGAALIGLGKGHRLFMSHAR